MTQRYGFCIYCGQPTSSQVQPPKPVTCKGCRDLLAVDPHYNIPDQWKDAR